MGGEAGQGGVGQHRAARTGPSPALPLCWREGGAQTSAPLKPLSNLWAFPCSQKEEKGHSRPASDGFCSLVTPHRVRTVWAFLSSAAPWESSAFQGQGSVVEGAYVGAGQRSQVPALPLSAEASAGETVSLNSSFPSCRMMPTTLPHGLWGLDGPAWPF